MRALFRRYGGVFALGGAVIGSSVAAVLIGVDRHERLVQRLGFDLDAFERLRLWVLPFSPFVQADNGIGIRFIALMLLTIVALVLMARAAGQRWTFSVFFGTHFVSAFLTLAALYALAQAGSVEAQALLHIPDTGVSASAYGTLAAAFTLLGGRLRMAALCGLACWLASGFANGRLDVGIAHAIAAAAGLMAAGAIPTVQRSRPALHASMPA